MDNFAESTDRASDNTDGLNHSLKDTLAKLAGFAGSVIGINSVGQAISNAMTAGMQWEGISARFGEGFAEKADEAYAHVQKLSDALYINDQAFMQYSSNFATLARGFGVTEDAIADMSIGLTELAYDIYAKNNDFYTFEEALMAVRSAMVGEIEPIRLAGISITEATLKEVAATNGITTSVENMTEAQKAMLRYKAMVDQAYASGTVGTYIAEINTAEGASRALLQQLKSLAQGIGSLLMPVLSAVIPYIQAFISVLIVAVNAIGAFFGFKVKAPTWGSGMNDLASSAGGATEAVDKTTEALGGASKAAKKLKDYTMGFDELNVIKPQENSSGGGGGGGAGGGGGDLGLDFESLWTDAMIDSAALKAQKIADEILNAVTPVVEWIKEHFDDILDVALAIGAGLAAWKISTAVADVLEGLKVGGKIREWFKKNKIAIGVSLMVSGITLSALGAYDIGYEGANWANIIKTAIGNVLLVGGSLLTFGTGPLGWTVGLGLAITTNIVSYMLGVNRRAQEKFFGEIKLNAQEVEKFAKSLFEFDIDAQINLTEATVVNSQAAKKKLQESVLDLQTEVNAIRIGVEPDEDALAKLQSSVGSVVSDVTELLKQNQETVKVALSVVPPVNEGGEDISKSILSSTLTSNKVIEEWAKSLGEEISSVISDSMVDGLSDTEAALVTALSDLLSGVANALATGKAAGEFGAELELLLSDLTLDSFDSVLKEYDGLVDELTNANTEIAKEAYANLVSQEAALEFIADSYREKGEEIPAYIQTALDEARANVENFDLEGSIKASVDTAVEPGRQAFIAALQEMFGGDIGDIANFDTELGSFLYDQVNSGLSNAGTVEDSAAVVSNFLGMVVQSATRNHPQLVEAKRVLNISDWDLLGSDVQKELYDILVGIVGAEETDAILKEMGVTLSGSLGSSLSSGIEGIAPDAAASGAELMEKVIGGFYGSVESHKPDIEKAVASVNTAAGDAVNLGETSSLLLQTGSGMAFDMVNGIGQSASLAGDAWNKIVDGVPKVTTVAKTEFDGMSTNIGSNFDSAALGAMNSLDPLSGFVENSVTSPIRSGVGLLTADVSGDFKKASDDTQTAWSGTKPYFSNIWQGVRTTFSGVGTFFKEKFEDGWEKVKKVFAPWEEFFEDLWESISDKFSEIGTSIGDAVSSSVKSGINGILRWVEDSVNDAIDVINKAIDAINKAPMVEVSKVKHVSIPLMADGGFVGAGQLFIAREAGAEMVGSMNGHAAVANNDQIVEGISRGVYSAVVAAMSESSGSESQSISIYLDGKKIAASVEKHQRQRGASIMQGGVTYGY